MTTKSKSEVVVQIVESPKAEYVLSTDEFGSIGTLIDNVLKAENALFEGDLGMEKSAMALAKIMGTNPSYVEWETKRKAYVSGYMARCKNATEESAERSFQRVAKRMEKECGLSKPKAVSASAKSMSAKREKEKAELEALPDSALREQMAAYSANAEFDKAKRMQDELKRRAKEQNKDLENEIKALRDNVIKQIKITTDRALLGKISAMLPKV
jgi:predicted flavoprotein YhiN